MSYVKNKIQKNYTLPIALSVEWDKFQGEGSKESSRNAAAALLIYMILEASTKEVARKYAYENDIENAKIEVRKALRSAIVDAYWSGFIGELSDVDRLILMQQARDMVKKTKQNSQR